MDTVDVNKRSKTTEIQEELENYDKIKKMIKESESQIDNIASSLAAADDYDENQRLNIDSSNYENIGSKVIVKRRSRVKSLSEKSCEQSES